MKEAGSKSKDGFVREELEAKGIDFFHSRSGYIFMEAKTLC